MAALWDPYVSIVLCPGCDSTVTWPPEIAFQACRRPRCSSGSAPSFGNQAAMDAFVPMNAGTISPAEFFAPGNVGTIRAAAQVRA